MRNDYCDDYLAHAKGEERKGHKYLSREWVKGKWQYIYDEKLGGKYKKDYNKYKSKAKELKKESNRIRDEYNDYIVNNKRHIDKNVLDSYKQRKEYFDKRYDETVDKKKINESKYDASVAKKVDDIKATINVPKLAKRANDFIRSLNVHYKEPIGPSEPYKNPGKQITDEGEKRISEIENNKDRRIMTDLPVIKYADKDTNHEALDGDINPKYAPGYADYSQNCGFCSITYLARRLGYDVEAMPDTIDDWKEGRGTTNDELLECFNMPGTDKPYNTKKLKKDGRYQLYDDLGKESVSEISDYLHNTYDNGGYGLVSVSWKQGGGHSMIVDINENGEIRLIDSQIHDEFTLDELYNRCETIEFMKVDDLTLNDNARKFFKPKDYKDEPSKKYEIEERRKKYQLDGKSDTN